MNQPTVFRGAWALIAALCLSRALAFAARTHVVPFYPELMERMGVGYTASGVLYSAYMLTYALALTPMGAASDRYSPRLIMGAGFSLMAMGTFVLALVPWYEVALAARMVQGLGTAMVYSCSLKLVAVSFPRHVRARALSAIEVVIGASMLVTLTLFPVLSQWVSLGALFGWLGLAMVSGLILLAWLPAHPMGPVRYEAAAGGALLPADAMASAPAPAGERLPLSDILGRPVYLLTAVAFLGLFVVNGFFGWLPTYFAEGLGLGKQGGGLLMAVLLISEMIAAPLAGLAADKWSRRLPAIQIGGVALAITCMVAVPGLRGAMPYVVAVMAGTAIGWAISPLQALATDSHGPARAGVVTSLTSAAGQAGGVLAGVVFGWMIDVTGSFRYVWILGAVVALARVAVASMIREQRT